jgi:hypothetical protein
MGAVVFALVAALDPWFAPDSGFLAQAGALAILVGAGLLTYLAAAQLFGAAHFQELIRA